MPKLQNGAERYWDPALETQSRAEWRSLKLALLQKHVQNAYEGSPYYRSAFETAGVRPGDLKELRDLRRFPFLTKQILRDRQLAVPPFGDLVAVPERDIVYISCSSGSTGMPTASPFTARDFDDWIDYEARQFWSSGMRPDDRYCHSLNLSLFIGGPCVLGAQKLGALTIHAGTLPSERLLHLLKQFQATIIWTTPSYAWYLGETALKEGVDPRRDLSVKRIFVAGEPGGSISETRERIEALWGASVYDYYGLGRVAIWVIQQRKGQSAFPQERKEGPLIERPPAWSVTRIEAIAVPVKRGSGPFRATFCKKRREKMPWCGLLME